MLMQALCLSPLTHRQEVLPEEPCFLPSHAPGRIYVAGEACDLTGGAGSPEEYHAGETVICTVPDSIHAALPQIGLGQDAAHVPLQHPGQQLPPKVLSRLDVRPDRVVLEGAGQHLSARWQLLLCAAVCDASLEEDDGIINSAFS